MDAMILAAGLGTRLRPLTDTIPKALVEIEGITMLERVAHRLIAAGATRLIVNAHAHAEQIGRFIEEREGFGVETYVSDESDCLLDTGGALLKAAHLFRRDGVFLLHNADILTNLDLRALLVAHHNAGDPLATLFTMHRESTRYLAFDAQGLYASGNAATETERTARSPRGAIERLGFGGVHAISTRIFDMIEERGVFSIIPLYLRLAGLGERILPYTSDAAIWFDIGSMEKLERARAALATAEVPPIHPGN